MTTVTIRIDEETKRAAAAVASEYGFDLSSVTRAFYRQIARERRVPLNLSDPLPNAESLQSIREADGIVAQGGTDSTCKTARDLLDFARS